jgi:hypothetical protein
VDLRGLAEDEVWGENPVHQQAAAYKKIAAGVIKITNSKSKDAGPGQTEAKRRREDSNEAERAPQQLARRGHVEQPSERGRGEWRSSWRSRGARGTRGGRFGDSRGRYRASGGRGGYY